MNLDVDLITHPEIEARLLDPVAGSLDPRLTGTTSTDVLEVFADCIAWNERLNQEGLLHHFWNKHQKGRAGRLEYGAEPECRLRIFFIDDIETEPDCHTNRPYDGHDVQSIALWFQRHFGVSTLFLRGFDSPRNWVTIGSASFMRRSGSGTCLSLEGFYRYPPDFVAPEERRHPPVHVWYSHQLEPSTASTYLIHNCHPGAKQAILSCATSSHFRSLFRPLAVDAFLADCCLQTWAERVEETRKRLIIYEGPLPKELDCSMIANIVEDVYQLQQLLRIIGDLVIDVKDKLNFLVTTLKQRQNARSAQEPHVDTSVAESLEFLRAKNDVLVRWIINYKDRSQVQIDRFFNHAAHQDSALNVGISGMTSKIAISAQKDSSAMITMAALTMAFLPASFISALFSTVFFDTVRDVNGKVSLLVHPQWWILPLVTVPLTIIVFLIWIMWWRVRERTVIEKMPIRMTQRND
ncbi:hypothetical protein CVT26_001094 [Gymnopilus dilepis]|uniref:Uncharacterized protein n=1 Tax=Gymnopilus dilepis TaxID=231916 RepID=A0A409WYI0_9AGAR|nr:hypothetical protein CVT26_001094 [Gymnopilus dilepis]